MKTHNKERSRSNEPVDIIVVESKAENEGLELGLKLDAGIGTVVEIRRICVCRIDRLAIHGELLVSILRYESSAKIKSRLEEGDVMMRGSPDFQGA